MRSQETGVDAFSPHDLRRTFATRLLEYGTDINIVRQAIGTCISTHDAEV
ncbi:MAG: site-specific integrase [Sutterella wadsworthensis]|nr:site-specific integrase [Sutterella wadsworthensis]